jgi:hypothetical protein
MNIGYLIIIGFIAFIAVVFKLLQLHAHGFFKRFKKGNDTRLKSY